jgi:mevalonate kinase
VIAARAALAPLGGTAKTTGAGGGDIGIAVIPGTEHETEARRLLIEAGCQPLVISVDQTGVDLQPDAQ